MTLLSRDFARSIMTRVRSIAAATMLAAPIMSAGAALAQDGKTITAVLHSGLRVLDPIITTAHITRNHGYMIYDVLVAQNKDFAPQPQMADFAVSEDGLTYTFTLRDGLKFHDGAPVTAADAVASLQRWGKRDAGGQLIFDVTASLEATDDKTITWTLSTPFGPLLDIVSKQSSVPPFIMPARVAQTPADQAISDNTGSGPFVFVKEEFEPGVSVTYAKFEDYVPRAEPADWMAGGKVVKVDRVKWVTMPDAQTAINALVSGEIDYLEQTPIDLLPLLETSPDVAVEVRNSLGYQTMGRMNFKHPPFDNMKIRQAALKAMRQEPILATMIGNPKYYKKCGAIFGCGTPLASEAGTESLTGAGDVAGAKALLKEAGYDGTPIVLMQPTDVVELTAQPVVAAQLLREAGFNVDMQAMDWQSVVTRRANQAAPSEGGWNIFFTNWMVPEISSPLLNSMVNGGGDSAWFGWPDDPELEALRAEFIAATSLEARKQVAARIQAHVVNVVNYIPLGQYLQVQSRRTNIVNMIPSPVLVFWEVNKT
ncbi:ABC transporter substrate-binding protein [Arvimicrobium flavum]|uniref:ABC transporter substrate-binding protein n=1 Tax=Arvimicrobium flavum TaxID=3393320 RepID=UPI00237A6EB8|nr:ABC transporter substrate-binding protein [Mesorhizobium shangrilense]